jgi:hypothetical protein
MSHLGQNGPIPAPWPIPSSFGGVSVESVEHVRLGRVRQGNAQQPFAALIEHNLNGNELYCSLALASLNILPQQNPFKLLSKFIPF